MKSCGFWSGHNWSKWREFSRVGITRTGDRSNEEVGMVLIQERFCETCGFKEIDQQKVTL